MTPLQICNIALGHLGEASIITMGDNTPAAKACSLHYDLTRDEVLRAHRWNFAIGRDELTEEEAPPFGWNKRFALPADCLRSLEVNDSEEGDWITDKWVVEGRSILTNADSVRLVYVRSIGDEALTDPLFARAFSVKLAAALSETIRGSTSKTGDLLQLYEAAVAPLARRVDANEGNRRKGMLPLNSFSVRSRFGYPNTNGRLRP